MEDTNEKRLDDFVKKVVSNASLESPSVDFTENIISKIAVRETNNAITVYQPLISKTSWLVLATLTILLIAYIFIGKFDLTVSWLPNINTGVIENMDSMVALSQIQLPNTVVYALIGLMLFFYLQIIFLKKYLDSRLELS
ncbi:hypothetical protein [uncultured Eudoraea sp.]|uniref:hypothetical protein n=1 Tax=uncultured Eudoraea sp. TaxID=1035614 RepID=UPI00261DA1E5|nr:hypothetical protein [uncultured Eudoraea sp.]